MKCNYVDELQATTRQSRKVTQELNAVRDTAQGSHGAEGAHCHLVRFSDDGHKNRRVHKGNRDQAHRRVKCSQLRVVQRHHRRARCVPVGSVLCPRVWRPAEGGLNMEIAHPAKSRGKWFEDWNSCASENHLQRALIRCFGMCLLPVWELEVFVAAKTMPRPSATIALRVEHFVVGKQWCIEVGKHWREVQPECALAQSFVASLRIPSRAWCQGESVGHGSLVVAADVVFVGCNP